MQPVFQWHAMAVPVSPLADFLTFRQSLVQGSSQFLPVSSGPLTSADKHGFNTTLGNNPAKEELYPLLEFSLEKIAKAPHETRTPRVAVKEYVK